MSVIDRRRWRHGGEPSGLEWLDEALDLAEHEARVAAGEVAHAEEVALRRAEVLRLCRELRRQARSVLVTASDLRPGELVASRSSPGLCPSLEAVGGWIRCCMAVYDELQVTLGIRGEEEPRFGTRRGEEPGFLTRSRAWKPLPREGDGGADRRLEPRPGGRAGRLSEH
jgi:hypothetical protein